MQIQVLADEQIDAGLRRALIGFASARTLNGLISVLQGAEFAVQPLGVGVTLTVGQILDPINDLIEQFSTLMLYASVAFGVQKALLAIGGSWVISLLVSVTAIIWAWLFALRRSPPWLSRALLVSLLIRFAIPVVNLGSDLLYERLLADDYANQQRSIEVVSEVVKKSTPAVPLNGAASPSTTTATVSSAPPPVGPTSKPASAPERHWWERMKDRATPGETGPHTPPGAVVQPSAGPEKGWMDRVKERVTGAVPIPDLEAIKAAVDVLPERIVGLIVIFLLQTLILPIFQLWALYRTALGVALLRPS